MILFYWFRLLHHGVEEWSPGLVGALRGVQMTRGSHLQLVGALRGVVNGEAWFSSKDAVAEFLADPSNKPASIVPRSVTPCSASLCTIS
jgi:hypothetical protein